MKQNELKSSKTFRILARSVAISDLCGSFQATAKSLSCPSDSAFTCLLPRRQSRVYILLGICGENPSVFWVITLRFETTCRFRLQGYSCLRRRTSSWLSRSVGWFITDVSGPGIGPIFTGQAVQEEGPLQVYYAAYVVI